MVLAAVARRESGPSLDNDAASKRATIAYLYETYFGLLTRYIGARIEDRDEAADMASEVFVRALAAVGAGAEKGIPRKAWLFKIAHNLAIDHLRRRQRVRQVPLEMAGARPADGNLAEDAERHQAAEEVRAAMLRLTEGQQSVLALRFGGELTSREAATVLGKRPGAVRQLQHAAVQNLRELIEPL